jgi:hypothetical protein
MSHRLQDDLRQFFRHLGFFELKSCKLLLLFFGTQRFHKLLTQNPLATLLVLKVNLGKLSSRGAEAQDPGSDTIVGHNPSPWYTPTQISHIYPL